MKIKEIRESKGITRQELADLIGVSARTVGRYETEERTPDEEKVRQMAEVLGVCIGELCEEGKEMGINKQDGVSQNEVKEIQKREKSDVVLCPFRTYKRREKDGFEMTRFSECLYEKCAMYKDGCKMKP